MNLELEVKVDFKENCISFVDVAVSSLFFLIAVHVLSLPAWIMYAICVVYALVVVNIFLSYMKVWIVYGKRKKLEKESVIEAVGGAYDPYICKTSIFFSYLTIVIDLATAVLGSYLDNIGTVRFLAAAIMIKVILGFAIEFLLLLISRSAGLENPKECFLLSVLPWDMVREYNELKDSIYDGMDGLSYKKNIKKLIKEYHYKAVKYKKYKE